MERSRPPAIGLALLLMACAPAAPCTPGAAYDRGVQGLGPDPRCAAPPETRAANDAGFADRLRFDRLSTLPEDRLSGRDRLSPGVIEIAPLQGPAPPETP